MARKGLWNVAKEKMLEDRGALPMEDGDRLRECKAMHGPKQSTEGQGGNAQKKGGRIWTQRQERRKAKVVKERWRQRLKTVVKRRCLNPFSRDNFGDFCPVFLVWFGFSLSFLLW